MKKKMKYEGFAEELDEDGIYRPMKDLSVQANSSDEPAKVILKKGESRKHILGK